MKNGIKRIFAVILLVSLMLSVLPHVQIFAVQTDGVIRIEQVTAEPGSTVEVDILMENNPGIYSLEFRAGYTSEYLTLTGMVYNPEFGGSGMVPPLGNSFSLSWYNNQTMEDVTTNGVLATLTFQVSQDAPEDQLLQIDFVSGSLECYNIADQELAVSLVNGGILVQNGVFGDINGDRKATTRDVSRLHQYVVGWDVEVDPKAIDTNGDGKVTTRDVTRLHQYVVGWDVEIFYNGRSNKQSHTLQAVPAKEATCTEPGNIAYWTCTKCGKFFSDANGATQVSLEDVIVYAAEHSALTEVSAKAPTCTEAGIKAHWHCTTCDKYYADASAKTELTKSETVDSALGHTVVIDPAVAPTYTSSGLTQGSHCSVCKEVFIKQEVLEPLEGYAITYYIVGADTYLAQQVIENPNPNEYNADQETITLVNLKAPKGYEFLGWYDAPQAVGGTRITSIPKGSTGDKILYAHWKETVYDITYKLYQTPLGAITEERYLHYTVSKGLKDLPNPEIYNYVFLGWYTNDGKEVEEIAVGMTGDITLNAYWTSKRNLTKAVSSLKDPIIIENSDDGVIYFTYELGTIENVPLSDAIWTIQSVAGLAQQKSETVSITISEEKATEIADMISKSTVDSATWTLSKDWNDVTSVTEEWAKEQGLTVEEANERTKTESGTYSVTESSGGCNTTTTTDGTTTVSYDSQNYTHGNSAEFNAKISGSYSSEAKAGVKLWDVLDVGVSKKWEISGEIGGGYEQHQETTEHTGTDTTKINSTVVSDSTSWNNSTTNSETKAASQSESVSKALSEIISNTLGYGKTYSSGGENSESQEFSATDSKSVSTSSALTYFSSETKTTTTTYSTDGKSEGCYRLVIAGTVHVFGVVGYDVATKSYFTYTFNVLDDTTYEFLDYSPTLSFNDYENGAIPFEIPYFVHEYVASKTVLTEGLAYTTDSSTGTATVTNFGENIGTKDAPNWVYSSLDVVIPSYISSGGNAYKVTGISANAFAGKPIRSIMLGEYITEIPANAFKDCTALEQIYGNFTTIGDNAFSGCVALEDMTISPRTTHIGNNAFAGVSTLKVNALYAEFAPSNATEITQQVIQSAVKSGAKNITIDISKIAADTVLTLEVPAIDSFELIGDKKTTYTDLKIVSYAKSTKLKNLMVANCTRVPLEIKTGDLILDTVNITAPNFVLLLAEDAATVSLLRDSKLTSQAGNAVVAKNPQIESLKDENVWGSLRISGNFYHCGAKPDTTYMTVTEGKLISLTEEEFVQYIQGSYKITFDPNGGNADVTELVAFAGVPIDTLPVPSRTGYVFVGWFDENDCQIKEKDIYQVPKDITAIAKWSSASYVVIYDANGGTGTMEATTHRWGVGKTLTKLGFQNTGYSFGGWNTKADGMGTTYSDQQSVVNLTSKNGETVTLYAMWTKNVIVTLQADGAENDRTTQIYMTPARDTFYSNVGCTTAFTKISKPGKTGYTYAGYYYVDAQGKKTLCVDQDGNILPALKSIQGDQITLTAEWTVHGYTIIYEGNGATGGSTATSAHTYGVSKELTANGFERKYTVTYNYNGNGATNSTATVTYTFTGWKAEDGTIYGDMASVKNLSAVNGGKVKLSAQWKAASVVLPTPTRTGYTFSGWYTSDYTSEAGNAGASYTPTTDITLYAVWTKLSGEDGYYTGDIEISEHYHYFNMGLNKTALATLGYKKLSITLTVEGMENWVFLNPAPIIKVYDCYGNVVAIEDTGNGWSGSWQRREYTYEVPLDALDSSGRIKVGYFMVNEVWHMRDSTLSATVILPGGTGGGGGGSW